MALKKTGFRNDEEAIFDNTVIYKWGAYWCMRMWFPKEYNSARFSLKTYLTSTAKNRSELHYHELKVQKHTGNTYFSKTIKMEVAMYLADCEKDVAAGIITFGQTQWSGFASGQRCRCASADCISRAKSDSDNTTFHRFSHRCC